MIYRREIDGLRALAVVPVILFHAGISFFSGGYVGVDVFFVISGYLITSILISEFEEADFSISRFYERRARRILPILFFVMLCCVPLAWMWMPPSAMKDFSQSIVAVVFFASNILFLSEDGYFAPSAELQPLLHTWSLAVEEQFYLLFPIFLMIAWRFGRNRVLWIIFLAAAVSFAASEWGWRYKPSANFYLALTRAWELLVGSICAFWLTGRQQRANNLLGITGISLILFAIFYFEKMTPSPSAYTLVPVLGSALIVVFGGGESWAAKLLGNRCFVGLGLISYSAYLWHQPLFAFARIRSVSEPSSNLMAALSALTLVLAYFSWRYVERPCRESVNFVLPIRHSVFIVSSLASTVFIAIGLAGHLSNGFEARLSPVSKEIMATAARSPLRNKCHVSENNKFPVEKSCVFFGGAVETAVLGNSHGVELSYELGRYLKKYNKSLLQLTISGCVPNYKSTDKYCVQFFKDRLEYIQKNKNIKNVVIAFRYDMVDLENFEEIVNISNNLSYYGKNVIMILQAPTLKNSVIYQIPVHTKNKNFTFFHRDHESWRKELRDHYKIIKKLNSDINVVDVSNIFCFDNKCYSVFSGNSLYFDDNHMSLHGAKLVSDVVARKLLK